MRGPRLTKSLVIRVSEPLYDALVADADRHGRTVAQSARFYLRAAVVADRLHEARRDSAQEAR